MPVVSDYTALLGKTYWTGVVEAGQSAFLTFSFPKAAESYLSDEYSATALASFNSFTSAEIDLARSAIAKLESITGLRFLEVAEGADINFQSLDFNLVGKDGFSGFAYYPSLYGGINDIEATSELAGDIFMNSDASFSSSAFLETLIHELGHAVGLKHPFETETDNPNTLETSLDNEQQTVMSYTSVSGYVADEYGPLDVAALAAIYGSSGSFGSHLKSWAWSESSETLTQNGTSGAELILGVSHGDIIVAGGGADTISAFAGDDFISGQDGDDYAAGGDGDDSVYSGSGSDLVEGGNGNDEIGGGSGNDTIEGDAGTDTLYGGAGSDSLLPGTENDVVWAGEGADLIQEYSNHFSDDILGGGAGNDTIYGGGGSDVIYGGKGDASTNNDRVIAGDGQDTIYGGNGSESYVGGGGGADLVFGGSGDDYLSGEDGNDTLWGGSGDDTLWGGDGSDLFGFVAGSGSDQIGDFDVNTDQLDFSSYGITKDQINANIDDFGSSIRLNLFDGDSIYLFGVTEVEFLTAGLLA